MKTNGGSCSSRPSHRSALGFVVVSLLAVLAGCGQPDKEEAFDVPERVQIEDVVWLPDGRVYYVVKGVSEIPDQLWRSAPDGAAERVIVSVSPSCLDLFKVRSLFSIEGDLGVSADCTESEDTLLLRVKPSTLQTTVVASAPMSTDSVAYSSEGFYLDHNIGICRHMSFASERSWSPLGVERSEGEETATLSAVSSSDFCGDRVEIGYPATSMDGSRLTFAVLPEKGPVTLYYGRPGEPAKAMTNNIGPPKDVAVSPDGRLIAASDRGRGLLFQIWLVDTERQSISPLAEGRFGEFTFSPDGRQLVAVIPSPDAEGDELVLVDLLSHTSGPVETPG